MNVFVKGRKTGNFSVKQSGSTDLKLMNVKALTGLVGIYNCG